MVVSRTAQPSVFDRYVPARRTRRLSDVTCARIVFPVGAADRSAGAVSAVVTVAFCVLGAHAARLRTRLVHDAPLTVRALHQPTRVVPSNCNETKRIL